MHDSSRPITLGEAVINTGIMGEQSIVPVRQNFHRFPTPDGYTITDFNSTAPWISGNLEINPQSEIINFVILSPSAKGNAVHLSVGESAIRWVSCGGVYYPRSDFQCPAGSGPQVLVLPAGKNWVFAATIFRLGITANYTDWFQVIIGYEPDLPYLAQTLASKIHMPDNYRYE